MRFTMPHPDHPPRAFVIGHPVAHSRSPLLHRFWLDRYEIAGSYEPLDIAPADLPAFFDRLRSGGEFAGGNVTIPHKEQALQLADEVDAVARAIGAVNTLFVEKGRIRATNTDWLGFLGNLDQNAPDWDHGLEHAIVLGAGGAARGILYALLARQVPRISLLNRTPERAEALAREFGGPIDPGGLEDYAHRAGDAGLLVNTSSVGLHSTRFEMIDPGMLEGKAVVTDAVYAPLRTPLLTEAERAGCRTVDGLGMLLHQAVPGFAGWFGITPEVDEALRAHILADLEAA